LDAGLAYLGGRLMERAKMNRAVRINRWRTTARTVALLVLALIVPDIWDVACDSLGLSQPDSSISSQNSTHSDPCVAFCVPDCFCCSTVTPAVTVALAAEPTPLSDLPATPVQLLTEGVPPVLDHIPITTV
jgi:hypothetical protein